MPGKKDKISAKINDTIEKRRQRLLLDDKINVHRNYFEEHPNNPVEESKVFQLRPPWLILIQNNSIMSVSVCIMKTLI